MDYTVKSARLPWARPEKYRTSEWTDNHIQSSWAKIYSIHAGKKFLEGHDPATTSFDTDE